MTWAWIIGASVFLIWMAVLIWCIWLVRRIWKESARALRSPPRGYPRVMCAWCGEMISPGVEPESHGICPDCFVAQMARNDGVEIKGATLRGPLMITDDPRGTL